MTSLAQAGRKLVYLAAFTTSLLGSRAEAEIIGIWDVVAPISASLVSGTTNDPFFFWLNVVDAPSEVRRPEKVEILLSRPEPSAICNAKPKSSTLT